MAVSRAAIELFCRVIVRRNVRLRVDGLDHVPRHGPVLLAAHHEHHLYDAAILMAQVPRPLHFLVAFDWAHGPRGRFWLELACALARSPGLLRAERVSEGVARGRSAYAPREVGPYLRAALTESSDLLGAGRALVVFPEAYPTIDPEGSSKGPDGFLPFRPGFVRIARMAERRHGRPVPIVPVGFAYARRGRRWDAVVRFGPPLAIERAEDDRLVARRAEAAARALSAPSDSSRIR